MINKSVTQAIGLTGNNIQISFDVAGGDTLSTSETEVVFQLIKKDKSSVTIPLVGITTESVGNPFRPVEFNPKKYAHLKDLDLADKFPASRERPFQLLISEPHFSILEKQDQRMSPDPSLPSAKLTELGWILRGAIGVVRLQLLEHLQGNMNLLTWRQYTSLINSTFGSSGQERMLESHQMSP